MHVTMESMEKKILWSMRLILFVGMTLLFMLLLAVDGSAKTITVDDDGGADYEKIQDAINNSTDGDIIRVYDGTYYENIDINMSLKLEGNGSDTTIIDGRVGGECVMIRADNSTISKFTIINGFMGISLNDATNCTIIKNNLSYNRRGIILRDSWNNMITENICYYNEVGGITLGSSRRNIIQSNICYSNGGYGIHLGGSDNNILRSNNCNTNRVGISIAGISNELFYNEVYENEKGIFISQYASSTSLHFNNIYNNSDYGASIAFYRDDPVEASDNWWGDPTGPYHYTENINGIGDNVSDHIDFEPWLKEPYTKPGSENNEEDADIYFNIILWIIFAILSIILFSVIYFTFRKSDFNY